MPPYAIRVMIMRAMGWDYYTYRAQPQFIIEQVLMFLNSESQAYEEMKPKPEI